MEQPQTLPDVRLTVAVVGLGGIGGVVAGALAAAGAHDVMACVRTPLHRLVVERPGDTIEVPLRSLVDPADASQVDWVLLCTKAHQAVSAAPWLARLCGSRTRVAVLQNGIRHAERLAPLVGGATVVPTIVYYNGERLAPDRMRMRHVTAHDLAVRQDADGEAFAALLAGTGMRLLFSPDFDTLAWRKLLINAVANPITALTLRRQSVLRRDDVKALCMAVLEEAVAVARADGADVAPDEAARTMAILMTYPAEAGTSMYFDRMAGRTFEADALTGAIVAAGARLAIPTPLNGALLTLLRATCDG